MTKSRRGVPLATLAVILAALAAPAAATPGAGETAAPVVAAAQGGTIHGLRDSAAPALRTGWSAVAQADRGAVAPDPATDPVATLKTAVATALPHGWRSVETGDAAGTLATTNPVPEPGNWALVLAGVLGVGAIARRRVNY